MRRSTRSLTPRRAATTLAKEGMPAGGAIDATHQTCTVTGAVKCSLLPEPPPRPTLSHVQRSQIEAIHNAGRRSESAGRLGFPIQRTRSVPDRALRGAKVLPFRWRGGWVRRGHESILADDLDSEQDPRAIAHARAASLRRPPRAGRAVVAAVRPSRRPCGRARMRQIVRRSDFGRPAR